MKKSEQMNKNEKNTLINVKKLRKPKLRSGFSIFARWAGKMDMKNGMIQRNGQKFQSTWIAKKQAGFDKYSAELFKVAGEIMKPAYVQREFLNEELKKHKRDLEIWKGSLPSGEVTDVQQKREVARVQKYILMYENQVITTTTALKEVKIAIEEADHELNQVLQSKKHVVELKILDYLHGAKIASAEDNEYLTENKMSKTLYEKLGEEFEYDIAVRKENDKHE